MRLSLVLVSMIIWFGNGFGYSQTPPKNLHAEWNTLLKTYVDNQGNVDYKNLK